MVNELYNSDIYLGADYSDGLKHWKYISRKKDKNGKWVYTYRNNAYENAKKNRNKSYKDYSKKESQYLASDVNYKINRDIYLEDDGEISERESKKLSEYREKRLIYLERYQEAGKQYLDDNSYFKKINIETLPSRIIGNGAAAVANVISKLMPSPKKKGKAKSKAKSKAKIKVKTTATTTAPPIYMP